MSVNTTLTGDYLSMSEAAKLIPKVNGRSVSDRSLWRWAKFGCRGVRLEATQIGGVLVTTREAIEKFLANLNKRSNLKPRRTLAGCG